MVHCAHVCPYGGRCPVPPNTPVRFTMYLTKKCIDFYWSEGRGGRDLHQHDALKIANQCVSPDVVLSLHKLIFPAKKSQWTILPAEPHGYLIRHIESGRYLSTGRVGANNRIYMTTHELGNVFIFEDIGQGVWM